METKLWSKEFVAIASSTLLIAWAFYALIPTLPIYLTRELGISHGHTGMVMASFSVAALLMRPVGGYLADGYPRFVVFVVSLSLMTVAYGIYPLIGGVAAMASLRFIHGAIWGVCHSSTAPVLADIVPPSRLGEGIGIYALSVPVGMTVGPMFGLAILQEHGADVMFLATLSVSFLSLVLAFFARTPFKPFKRKKFAVQNLIHKKALPISWCMFFIMIAFGAIIIFAGIYAGQKEFSNISTFFLCFSAAIFVSRVFLGKLFDRGYFFQLILVALALTAIGMIWLGYAPSPTHFLVGGILNGLGFGILLPTCQAAINTLVDSSERGAANSTYLLSYDLGIGSSSLLVGFLSEKIALGVIYRYSAIVILLAAGIFVFRVMPHYRRNRLKDIVRV